MDVSDVWSDYSKGTGDCETIYSNTKVVVSVVPEGTGF